MEKQLYNIMYESIDFITLNGDLIFNHDHRSVINDTQNIIKITKKNYRLICKFILVINDDTDDYCIECDYCHDQEHVFKMTRFYVTHEQNNIIYDICSYCISSYVPNTYIHEEEQEEEIIKDDDIYNSRSARSLINNCNNTSKFEECIICYDKKMTYELFPHCNHSVCFDCFIKIDKQTCYYKCC